MLGALSKAFMNLPVGEIEAAVEGRPVTAADRNRTVRDVAGGGDPNFERELPARDRRQPRDDAGGHEGDGRGAAGDHARRMSRSGQRNRARHRQPALADLSRRPLNFRADDAGGRSAASPR